MFFSQNIFQVTSIYFENIVPDESSVVQNHVALEVQVFLCVRKGEFPI